jgi:1,2-diacylglycerol 3-alpha-glucosyltransferase
MSTQVIAVSELVRDTLRRELTKSSKIEIIRNGIELEQLIDLRNNRFKKGDPLVIGYLGRIDKSKGIKYLIQAYAEILKRDASVKLMVAGAQGNFYDQLVKSVEQFPDENIVIYPYRINKMEFFDAIDILVHLPVSPEAESFGLVYLEGIAAGLKCIFTQSGILERLKLEESQNQVKIVPFMDSGATVEALTEIIEEIKSNQFVQLSEEFLQDFSKQSMFNSYLNFVKNKLE